MMTLRSPAWVPLLAVLLALAPVRVSAEARPSIDQLVQFFDTVVFGSEIEGVERVRTVRRWGQTLRVEVREFGERIRYDAAGRQVRDLRQRHIKRRHLDFVQKHLTALSRLTRRKTEDFRAAGKDANIRIYFLPRFQLQNPDLEKRDPADPASGLWQDIDPAILKRVAVQGGCYFFTWPDAKTRKYLIKALIVVNADLPLARKDHCLLEELTQSLGFPNDIRVDWPSIFSDNSSVRNPGRVRELSRIDRIIIRTLYDPRIVPGMGRADALGAARRIIADLDRKLP